MPSNSASAPRSTFIVILTCFFISGVAGLIYQVAWTKALGLVFGHTVYAIATVLAAFMGGLAAGSAFLGRWGQRRIRPIALYGWIEILIGVTGFLSIFGLEMVRTLYLAVYHAASSSTVLLLGLRLVASLLVLFLPTFLMGGTLPILTRGVTRTSTELGARLGRLYAINTAGAVAGALAAGFLLLPWIGLHFTILFAAFLNILAGCFALVLKVSPTAEMGSQPHAEPAIPPAAIPIFVLVSFAFVGATAMSYEIAWTRLLATTLGSSTYAFTVMVTTFLIGIALGSRVFESWVARKHDVSLSTFSTTQSLTGLAAVLFLIIFQQLPVMLWALVLGTHKTFAGLVFAQFATCALAMLPAAIVFGFNFPVVTVLIAKYGGSENSPSRAVGVACAANTLGAIVGAIATGFWLVPTLGSYRLIAATAAVNFAIAVFLLARQVPRRTILLTGNAALAAFVVAASWSGMFYDAATANFNMITSRALYPSTLRLEEVAHLTDVLFAEDGQNASIAVVQSEHNLALLTNGKTDASTGDEVTQLMLGHLGMMLHPGPRKVLIIGFGSGMTASAVARYRDVQRIDCVEIEPAVIRAAPYLDPLNRDVLKDPRLHVVVDDARNFLFTSPDQYDLIVSEPSNPWIAGVATLFTEEFYGQVHSHLAPGGMMVQWVQAYSIFPDDLRTILGTLAHQFPKVTVWQGQSRDLMLLAQTKPGQFTLDTARDYWSVPELKADYESMGLKSAEGLVAYHVLDDADLRTLVANAPRNTDDLTRLEYRAPLAVFTTASRENMQMLWRYRSTLLPASVRLPDTRAALFAIAQTFASLGDRGREEAFLIALQNYPATVDSEVLRADWLASSGSFEEANKVFAHAHRLDPSSIGALVGLAEIARVSNEYATAESFLNQALANQPQSVAALATYAMLERSRGNWKQAVDWQNKCISASGKRTPEALVLLGEFFLRSGDPADAARTYAEALTLDPYTPDARRVLGEIFRRAKQWDQARVQLEVVVRYYPNSDPSVYVSLADVYRNMGRSRDAEATVRKAERIFAGQPSVVTTAKAN